MLAIPDHLLDATPISEAECRREVALLLYTRGLPPGKAAEFAQISKQAFDALLASRDIPLPYDVDDLEQDLATLRALC
ncbi:MAG: UPF0175 family protein [Bacteroidota bacterium]